MTFPRSQDVDRWRTEPRSAGKLREGDKFLMDGEAITVTKDAYEDRRERCVVVWSEHSKFRFQRGQSVRKIVRQIHDESLEKTRGRAIEKLIELHCLVDTVEQGIVPDDALGMIRRGLEGVIDELSMPDDAPWEDK